MEFEIGQKVELKNYTEAAIYCNNSGDRHIEQVGSEFVIVANPAPKEPTVEEKVAKLEAETGLTRAIRELVLTEGSGASEYVRKQAQEIEDLAQVLRVSDDINEINEAINAETIVNLTEK